MYSRGLKSIEITPEVRGPWAWMIRHRAGTDRADFRNPQGTGRPEVYNGGIGTHVKASTKTNAQVGDKA